MKLFVLLGTAIAIINIYLCDAVKKLPSTAKDEQHLSEEYAVFNGSELENLGKKTYFYGLSKAQGPRLLMQFLEYGNFDYKQFSNSVNREEIAQKMIHDLKFAKDKGLLFASYGNVYKRLARFYAAPF